MKSVYDQLALLSQLQDKRSKEGKMIDMIPIVTLHSFNDFRI